MAAVVRLKDKKIKEGAEKEEVGKKFLNGI